MKRSTNILIVEDSTTQALLLKRILETQGYNVTVAENGQLGLDALRKSRPDIVISDVMMPVMDGYTMCRTIKSDDDLQSIPIILLTTLSDPEDIVRGLEASADAYVIKPYNREHLLAKVESVLSPPVRDLGDGQFEIAIGGKKYKITSSRQQILNLLLFTYENAIFQNRELIKVQYELKKLNEKLEEKVEERTAELSEEIAERKKIEASLVEANEQLKELDRLKSEFLSTVSHELRTPLSIIREGVSLCLEGIAGDVTEMQLTLLSSAQEGIDRLTRLITDLLDISKIEAGKIRLRKSSLNVCEVVKKTEDRFRTQAEEKGLRLTSYLPDNDVILFADGDKLFQIFDNLISNAIRFTDTGGQIGIHLEETDADVICRVSDSGIGIAKQDIPKLFSKFEQVGRVDGPGYKGTGLGLAIVKGLVEKHGGTISVTSKPKKGTTFTFTLKKVSFPTILIVDDEQSMIELNKKALEPDGYHFIEANDGLPAVDLARDKSPSLIILDMVMKAMNGYEVIGRLKQDKRTVHIPVIIVSGHSVDRQRLSQIDTYSVIPILKKPYQPEALRELVRDTLSDADTLQLEEEARHHG